MKQKDISFVVPAYNEQENIRDLYARILTLTQKFELDWELIFVNDGSIDATLEILRDICSKDSNVKLIDLSRNFGHQAALSAGLKHACGNGVISMDCDLQDPPEIIEKMIQKWHEGYEIVYARRMNFRKDNIFKKIGSKIYYKFLGNFSQIDIPRNVGDFRLVDKKVLKIMNSMPEHSRYLRGMAAWVGFKHTFVDYQRPDREKGQSAYSLSKLAALGMDGMFNFSMLPLRLGFVLGFVSIIAGIGLLTYQIGDVLINHVYYHLYKWLIVVLLIFMGFLFMLLWIVGEYIGKIYDEVRQRPLFIISEMINFDNK